MGNLMIAAGAILLVAGLLYKAGWLSWFGRLPGDIVYESEQFRLYIPLATMLLLSIALSLLLWLMRKF